MKRVTLACEVVGVIGLISLIGLMSVARAQTNAPSAPYPVVMPANPPAPATNAPDAAAPVSDTNAPTASVPVAPDVPTAPDTTQSSPVTPQVAPPNIPGATNTQAEEIDDIRQPYFYLHSWFWLWVALGAVAAIGLIVLLWHWFKPLRQLSAKSAYELTLEKLEKARSLLQVENPMPYAVFVSETIRSYLGQRFQSPSTRRTTDEFLKLMEFDQATPLAEHRDLLRHFLQACDLVKFARYRPTLVELEDVQQRAVTFVTATKPVPAQRNGRTP